MEKTECKYCEGSGCESCMYTGKMGTIPRHGPSVQLVNFMADQIWDRLIDEYGERFSDVIYMALEDPTLKEEMLSLDEDYDQLSKEVKIEIGNTFKLW